MRRPFWSACGFAQRVAGAPAAAAMERHFCRYSSKQRNLSFARICSSAEKYMSPK